MATITTSGAIILKAGKNVNATLTGANYDTYIEQGEGKLSALTKFDIAGNWATMSGAAIAPILMEYAESSGAIEAISYDMSGYTSRVEAEDMINIHLYRMKIIEKMLSVGEVLATLGVT